MFQDTDLKRAYQLMQDGDSFAAQQLLESARWKDLDTFEFFGDLVGICNFDAKTEAGLARKIAEIQRSGSPHSKHEIWLTQKATALCRGFRAPQLSPLQGLERFNAITAQRNALLGPTPVAKDLRVWFDNRVATTRSVNELWTLAETPTGAVGGEYFGVRPNYGHTDSPAEASLAMAQSVAITRMRCQVTRACGPEQLDSVLLCARYYQCKPGISVEEVWRNVASPAELRAARVIHQRYLVARQKG